MNQTLHITKQELMAMLTQAAETAVAKYAALACPESDLISQREACRLYGHGRVAAWVKAGLIHNKGRIGGAANSKKLYSKAELAQAEYADRVQGALYFAR